MHCSGKAEDQHCHEQALRHHRVAGETIDDRISAFIENCPAPPVPFIGGDFFRHEPRHTHSGNFTKCQTPFLSGRFEAWPVKYRSAVFKRRFYWRHEPIPPDTRTAQRHLFQGGGRGALDRGARFASRQSRLGCEVYPPRAFPRDGPVSLRRTGVLHPAGPATGKASSLRGPHIRPITLNKLTYARRASSLAALLPTSGTHSASWAGLAL